MDESLSPHTPRGGTAGGYFWTALLAVVPALYLATGTPVHPALLRALLILTAVGEALAFVSNSLRPRRFAEQCGRPYDPTYHGVMQDFGFYNLGFALLLVLAAVDPPRYALAIGVVIASYLVHAATHVLRYFGLYFGGGQPIPTRPSAFELRDGLQLLVPAFGMILFFPA
jgi:hypothetical protein